MMPKQETLAAQTFRQVYKPMKKCDVVIIGVGDSLLDSPYGSRLASLFNTNNRSVDFWGWSRSNFEVPASSGRILLKTGQMNRLTLLLYYFCWIFLTGLEVYRANTASTRFLCIGTWSTIGPTVAGLIKRLEIVYINNDNLALSYRLPKGIRWAIGRVEMWLAKRAKVHVIPTADRWTGSLINMIVVQNTPTRALLDEAQKIAAAKAYARGTSLTLLVSGWLRATRGMEMILVVAQRLINDNCNLLLAGTPECSAAVELSKLANVTFLGRVSRAESIALYYRADLAMTFYDPAIPINRLAESNKWYECVLTGTPFIVNSEITTADRFRLMSACLSVDYGDVVQLEALLRKLMHDRSQIDQLRKQLCCIPCATFDEEFSPVLKQLRLDDR